MTKKRIMVLTLTVAVLGSASAILYASRNAADSTKNTLKTVYSVQNADSNKNTAGSKDIDNNSADDSRTISDEEAVRIATGAMKDYMGKEPDYFTATKIYRQEVEKAQNDIDYQQYVAKHPEEVKKLEAAKEKLIKENPEYKKTLEENIAKANAKPLITVWFTPANFDRNSVFYSGVCISD